MENHWNNVINKLFVDKKSLQKEFFLSGKISNYDFSKKTIYIKVEKSYLNKLLSSKIKDLRKELEKEFDSQIFKIVINDNDFEFNSSSSNEEILHVQKQDIVNTPISYKTTEKLISGKFVSNSFDDLSFRNRNIDLFFYNKLLYSTKKISFNYKITNINFEIKYSLIFSWTFIVPIVFGGIIISKKVKYLKLKNEIKHLINLKYVPLNQETKKFIELYI